MEWPKDAALVRSFHLVDGIFFSRRTDGAVVMTMTDGPRLVIDAYSWVSVVASVSAGGETAESYAAARDVHSGAE